MLINIYWKFMGLFMEYFDLVIWINKVNMFVDVICGLYDELIRLD